MSYRGFVHLIQEYSIQDFLQHGSFRSSTKRTVPNLLSLYACHERYASYPIKPVHDDLWLHEGKVSLERFSSFLQDTELLDSFSEQKVGTLSDMQHEVDDRIGFNNAVFAWSNEAGDGTQTPSSRAFRLRVEGNLTFKRNCINLIIGPT